MTFRSLDKALTDELPVMLGRMFGALRAGAGG
jgi:hypothetical protein